MNWWIALVVICGLVWAVRVRRETAKKKQQNEERMRDIDYWNAMYRARELNQRIMADAEEARRKRAKANGNRDKLRAARIKNNRG